MILLLNNYQEKSMITPINPELIATFATNPAGFEARLKPPEFSNTNDIILKLWKTRVMISFFRGKCWI